MSHSDRPTAPLRQDALLERLVMERHSCRAYLPTPVPRATIERLLSIAQRGPSWCNTQPWQVHLVSGPALDRLRTDYSALAASGGGSSDLDFPVAYRGAYQTRRKECGMALYASLGIGREDRAAAAKQAMENFRFFNAPHLAVVTTERDLGPYGAVDCGGYIALFLLAAQSLGIAAVPQAAVATHSVFVRQFLGVPDSRQVVAGIAFGWRQDDHPVNGFRTSRVQVQDTVTWVDPPP